MSKVQDIYYKFIVELNSSYTETATGIQNRYNRFVKLMYLTDDTKLCTLTNIYINVLKDYKAYDYNFMHTQYQYKCIQELHHAIRELNNYLTLCLNSDKHEWQIIAEQNGWKAPV